MSKRNNTKNENGTKKLKSNGEGNEANEQLEFFNKMKKCKLYMEDGTIVEGRSFGSERNATGECVFNTGMVGYPECLTDPSYRGQILVLTFPLVGNYGVPNDDLDQFGLLKYFESTEIHVSALIVSEYSIRNSHWQSTRSLSEWLKSHNIPAITGIDTRLLTKKIRVKGALLGNIRFDQEPPKYENPNNRNLAAEVSTKQAVTYGKGEIRITAVDCGIKYNIIRCLASIPNVQVTVVPWDYDITDDSKYDGLFLSNGPGDPTMVWKCVNNLQQCLNKPNPKPIFGICLGNQLLALAAGAKTYKMKFGNRSMNQPAVDLHTGRCYITPQNHGFAVDTATLPQGWKPYFRNNNDDSNEGIFHVSKPFFSAQFHPEAKGGPNDTHFLFDKFIDLVKEFKFLGKFTPVNSLPPPQIPAKLKPKKVLILGSGGLSIGQAGEFDYSGSQCIKAFKEEGIFTILVNPNIATIQTSKGLADVVYFLPVKPEFIIDVIKKERPDSITCSFGGQTALNCGIELDKMGIFTEYGIRVLGTPIQVIIDTEDRERFAQKLAEIDVKVAPSAAAVTIEEAMKVAHAIGYPVLIRAAYALGGLGSGFASDEKELIEKCEKAFAVSPQVLIDKSLRGWKELEYEVVRDCQDNCITVCNMENMDPLGIHTGDSIVIAPSQTLTNEEYFMLRTMAIKVIRHLGVVGECNIQYALNPDSLEVYVIEVNARLSRSSALASKATGYPLAFVAAKLGLNFALPEVKNAITKRTYACFEPSLDYVVLKIPRWDLDKFFGVIDNSLGSAMKSVGEVMSIGRSFEEAFQSAIRMVNPAFQGFEFHKHYTDEQLESIISIATPQRVEALAAALHRGWSCDKLYELSKIDKWFLYKLERIVAFDNEVRSHGLSYLENKDNMIALKQAGFSDKRLAQLLGDNANYNEIGVREIRKNLGVTPFVKQIDTLAAEFPAYTNYLYVTYHGGEHDVAFNDNGTIVLGSGCYRIGSSVEFDWCAVGTVSTLRQMGFKTIMINYNPETVSTDYDMCDRLYFQELSFERVVDIYEIERSDGVVVSVGGQTPNNLALPLFKHKVKILGTSPESIDSAEDRFKFSKLLDSIGVDQPAWKELTDAKEAIAFSEKVGYPVLVRPSYVLSGAAMNVAYNSDDLVKFLKEATNVSPDHPVVITKFIEDAKEIEMDAVAKDGEIIVYAISEHVENAGVHSGDATLVLPPQNLYVETMRRIMFATRAIAKSLKISGPVNIQYIAKENEIKVIECNLRASRTFPFISKVLNINFIEYAAKAMVGVPITPVSKGYLDLEYVAIKAPQFSFARLAGADPVTGVEMASTGEVACFGLQKYEAFLLSLIASGFKLPRPNSSILISSGNQKNKALLLAPAQSLVNLGYKLYATDGTAKYLQANGVAVEKAYFPDEKTEPSITTLLKKKQVDLVINIPKSNELKELNNHYNIRRLASDFGIPLLINPNCAKLFVDSLERHKGFTPRAWTDYIRD